MQMERSDRVSISGHYQFYVVLLLSIFLSIAPGEASATSIQDFRRSNAYPEQSTSYLGGGIPFVQKIGGPIKARVSTQGTLAFRNDRHDSVIAFAHHPEDGRIIDYWLVAGASRTLPLAAWDAVFGTLQGSGDTILGPIASYFQTGKAAVFDTGTSIASYPVGTGISYVTGSTETLVHSMLSIAVNALAVTVAEEIPGLTPSAVAAQMYRELLSPQFLNQVDALRAAHDHDPERFFLALGMVALQFCFPPEELPPEHYAQIESELESVQFPESSSCWYLMKSLAPQEDIRRKVLYTIYSPGLYGVVFRTFLHAGNLAVQYATLRQQVRAIYPEMLGFDMSYGASGHVEPFYRFRWDRLRNGEALSTRLQLAIDDVYYFSGTTNVLDEASVFALFKGDSAAFDREYARYQVLRAFQQDIRDAYPGITVGSPSQGVDISSLITANDADRVGFGFLIAEVPFQGRTRAFFRAIDTNWYSLDEADAEGESFQLIDDQGLYSDQLYFFLGRSTEAKRFHYGEPIFVTEHGELTAFQGAVVHAGIGFGNRQDDALQDMLAARRMMPVAVSVFEPQQFLAHGPHVTTAADLPGGRGVRVSLEIPAPTFTADNGYLVAPSIHTPLEVWISQPEDYNPGGWHRKQLTTISGAGAVEFLVDFKDEAFFLDRQGQYTFTVHYRMNGLPFIAASHGRRLSASFPITLHAAEVAQGGFTPARLILANPATAAWDAHQRTLNFQADQTFQYCSGAHYQAEPGETFLNYVLWVEPEAGGEHLGLSSTSVDPLSGCATFATPGNGRYRLGNLLARVNGSMGEEFIGLGVVGHYLQIAGLDQPGGSGGTPGTEYPATHPLNDTGIVWSGHATSGNASTCDPAHPAGQDCFYGRDAAAVAGQLPPKVGGSALNNGIANAFDYTKISNSGNALPASATLGEGPNDWACTRDNVTGLIWEVKTNSGLRGSGHQYKWVPESGPGFGQNSMCGGTLYTCTTGNYVAALNTAGLCGASDWRMPTMRELESIIDFGRTTTSPWDPDYFESTGGNTSALLWSDTLYAGDQNYVWTMRRWMAYAATRNSSGRVRLVRGGQ